MTELIKVLMERDDLTEEEVKEWIRAVKEDWNDVGWEQDPVKILFEDFGSEPDYLFDFIGEGG